MIAILKHGTTQTQRDCLENRLKNINIDVHISEGQEGILGLMGDAFIKSPTALQHKGFSAASYMDLTRVA